ncbi:MAG: hypothetical protein R2744_05325 [Bacteroidales bacterium]
MTRDLNLHSGRGGEDYIPTRKIRIPVDREKVLWLQVLLNPENADLIVPYIDITLKGTILKSQMMVPISLHTTSGKTGLFCYGLS